MRIVDSSVNRIFKTALIALIINSSMPIAAMANNGVDRVGNNNTDVLNAVLSNGNLNFQEKKYFYQLSKMLEENPYLDIDRAYQALRNVDILYSGDNSEYEDDVVGIYNHNKNVIEIFEDNSNHETMYHEIIHCIYNHKNKTSELPQYFEEGMTELLVNEYFSDKPFLEKESYMFEIAMTKVLANIVGSDEVLKAFSAGNMNNTQKVINRKMNINTADEWLHDVNILFMEYEMGLPVSDDYLNKVLSVLDKYYYDREDEVDEYLYYRGIIKLLNTSKPTNSYCQYLNKNGYYLKAYFSSELREKYTDNRLVDVYYNNKDSVQEDAIKVISK